MATLRWIARLTGLLTISASSFAAEPKPLLDPNDLPPPPSPGSPATLTHSQAEDARQFAGGLASSPPNADAAERALAKEVGDLKTQLDAALAKGYRADPALLLSDTYQESAHEWVMSKHADEFNASLNFTRNPRTKEAQARLNNISTLLDNVLLIELANNPKFLPLFASLYDAADQMRKTNKTAFQNIYSYARTDKLIGYTSESALPPASSLKEYLAELNKRYPLLLSKLEEMKTQEAIPADAFGGLKFGDLYRLLDGVAQTAVELRTPAEVKDLRQKLRTKGIQLANMRANRKPKPANP
jgi:hypothetical protein